MKTARDFILYSVVRAITDTTLSKTVTADEVAKISDQITNDLNNAGLIDGTTMVIRVRVNALALLKQGINKKVYSSQGQGLHDLLKRRRSGGIAGDYVFANKVKGGYIIIRNNKIWMLYPELIREIK